jgi:hypothetical protein
MLGRRKMISENVQRLVATDWDFYTRVVSQFPRVQKDFIAQRDAGLLKGQPLSLEQFRLCARMMALGKGGAEKLQSLVSALPSFEARKAVLDLFGEVVGDHPAGREAVTALRKNIQLPQLRS